MLGHAGEAAGAEEAPRAFVDGCVLFAGHAFGLGWLFFFVGVAVVGEERFDFH